MRRVAGQAQDEKDKVTYADGINWVQIEVIEALHDVNWQNIANKLQVLLRKEKNLEFREVLVDLGESSQLIAQINPEGAYV